MNDCSEAHRTRYKLPSSRGAVVTAKDETRWFAAFVPMNYGVSAAMVATSVYLLDPLLFDPSGAHEPGRWNLVAGFLIYAAFVLAFGTAYPRVQTKSATLNMFLVFAVGSVPLMAVGFMELALAVQALFAEPMRFWVALLAVPGTLSLLAMFNADVEVEKAERAEELEAAETITADSGKGNAGSTLKAHVLAGLLLAPAMAVLAVWIGAAFGLYYMLAATLLADKRFDEEALGSQVALLWHAVVPVALPTVLAIALIMPAIGIVVALLRWISLRGARNANRDLTAEEMVYIEESEKVVRAYAEARGYSKGYWLVAIGYLPLLIGMMGATLYVSFNIERWLGPVVAGRADAGDVFLYINDVGFSLLILLFASILWTAVPGMVAARFSKQLGERSGWMNVGVQEQYVSLTGRLTNFVRTGRLKPRAPIDPGRFLIEAGRSLEPFMLYPAVGLTILGLVFWQLDRGDYELITGRYIEVVDYWTQQPTRFAYADVESVEIECWFGKNDSLDVAYRIKLPDGHSVDLFDAGAIADQLSAYEKVEAHLVAAGARFDFATREPWGKAAFYAYHSDCVIRLAAEHDASTAERVRRLMRLDAWEQLP